MSGKVTMRIVVGWISHYYKVVSLLTDHTHRKTYLFVSQLNNDAVSSLCRAGRRTVLKLERYFDWSMGGCIKVFGAKNNARLAEQRIGEI
jgi:hypothetical protein